MPWLIRGAPAVIMVSAPAPAAAFRPDHAPPRPPPLRRLTSAPIPASACADPMRAGPPADAEIAIRDTSTVVWSDSISPIPTAPVRRLDVRDGIFQTVSPYAATP